MVATYAVFGGVYNNHLSLAATLEDARARGASEIYCLGDMGGFGPNPDAVFPYLREAPDLFVMQGMTEHEMSYIAKAAIPMFLIMVAMVFVLIAFPDLATWLPENMRQGPG